MEKYFNYNDTILDISRKYPVTESVFESRGFHLISEREKYKKFARSLTLKMAATSKNIDLEDFAALLNESILNSKEGEDLTLRKNETALKHDSINITGVLPCPVRIPLLESFNDFLEKNRDLKVNYQLKAASMGTEWIKDQIIDEYDLNNIPDIFISAGFDLFFDKKYFGKFIEQGVFYDSVDYKRVNLSFNGLELKDPKSNYSVISVVPAVFLVNIKELGEREIPKTWEDILKPEFRNQISVPVGDFDLFNALLLNIYKKFGYEGVRKLGANMQDSTHPSQMVKSHINSSRSPVITIMPYFFTRMIKDESIMKPVWPADGAIISPVFMLTRKDKSEKVQGIADFMASDKVGEILSHKGLFPSLNPDVDNRLDQTKKFIWPGWEYIYKNNIKEIIDKCEAVFSEGNTNGGK